MIGVRRDGVFDFLLKGILVFLLHLLGVEEVMLGAIVLLLVHPIFFVNSKITLRRRYMSS